MTLTDRRERSQWVLRHNADDGCPIYSYCKDEDCSAADALPVCSAKHPRTSTPAGVPLVRQVIGGVYAEADPHDGSYPGAYC